MLNKTCYDCAWSRIEVACTHNALICGKGEKTFCIPFTAPTPPICESFCKKSGVPVLEALSGKEREEFMQAYKNSQVYNPEISMEDFFAGADSGIWGIYPKG